MHSPDASLVCFFWHPATLQHAATRCNTLNLAAKWRLAPQPWTEAWPLIPLVDEFWIEMRWVLNWNEYDYPDSGNLGSPNCFTHVGTRWLRPKCGLKWRQPYWFNLSAPHAVATLTWCIHMLLCVCTWIYIYIQLYSHIYMYIYIDIYTYIYKNTNIHVYICIYMYIYVYMYTFTYILIYIYVYKCLLDHPSAYRPKP